MHELEPDVPNPRNDKNNRGNNSIKAKNIVALFIVNNLQLSITARRLTRLLRGARRRKKRRSQTPAFLYEVWKKLLTMFSLRWSKLLALVVVLVIDLGSKLLVIVAPEGAKDFSVVYGTSFTLPDGTDVTLTKGSSLRYNVREFRTGKREVQLVGSAFFAIEKGKDDFVVHSQGGLTTRMKEGLMEIRPPEHTDSAGDIGAEKVLIGGRGDMLQLADLAGAELGSFQGGDEITYRPYARTIQVEKHDDFVRDKDRLVPVMILQNMTFGQVAEKLGEKFNTEIIVSGGVQECFVVATFYEEGLTLEKMLRDLKEVTFQGMKCRIKRDGRGVIKRVEVSGNCNGDVDIDSGNVAE